MPIASSATAPPATKGHFFDAFEFDLGEIDVEGLFSRPSLPDVDDIDDVPLLTSTVSSTSEIRASDVEERDDVLGVHVGVGLGSAPTFVAIGFVAIGVVGAVVVGVKVLPNQIYMLDASAQGRSCACAGERSGTFAIFRVKWTSVTYKFKTRDRILRPINEAWGLSIYCSLAADRRAGRARSTGITFG